jgi:hypothetical protein
MNDYEHDLLEQPERQAVERGQSQPAPLSERATIHYTDLPQSPSDSPIAAEWNLYRRRTYVHQAVPAQIHQSALTCTCALGYNPVERRTAP